MLVNAREARLQYGPPTLIEELGEVVTYTDPVGGMQCPVKVIYADPYSLSSPLDTSFANARNEVLVLYTQLPNPLKNGTITWPNQSPRKIQAVQPHSSVGMIRLTLCAP